MANPALLAAVAGALSLQLAGLYLPVLNDLLKTRPLAPTDLLIIGALSTLGYATMRLDRIVHRDRTGLARATGRQAARGPRGR